MEEHIIELKKEERPRALIAYRDHERGAFLPSILIPVSMVRDRILPYLPFHLKVPVRTMLTYTPRGIYGDVNSCYNRHGISLPVIKYASYGTTPSAFTNASVSIYIREAEPFSILVQYTLFTLGGQYGTTYQTITPEYGIDRCHREPLPIRYPFRNYNCRTWKGLIHRSGPVSPHPNPLLFSNLILVGD